MTPRGAAVALLALPLLPACGSAQARGATRVVLDVEWSTFSESAVTVRRGVPVTFVVRNGDPIDHELIVGDAALQLRHERGTEPAHGDRPGEVTVPAGATAETTVTFERPGTLYFACHLPGHYAYGMRGLVSVVG
ncbi:MAG TPA: plastocyanin/azurin family copper-binding protein [Frankiaceae bacterium]|nr:plastocyanin/azurin family copper-binding protein [Frankiaceae bacterium]